MKYYDFLVVGSGIAGLSFALKAARHGSVGVLTKRKSGDSNTAWAQGGIACVTGDDDTFDSHVADTLDAGAGLCDEEAVRTIVSEGPERIQELIDLGVAFDREDDGDLCLGMEGGHSKRRILHHKDTTGKAISDALITAAREEPAIDLVEDHYAVDLVTTSKLGQPTNERCVGLYALNQKTG
ncbi:MAG: FAD-dependent oxidoreductase, partial [Verrucomicrobiota bacterium]